MTEVKLVQLDQEQINLILNILIEKRNDFDVLLTNQDGLEDTTIQEISLERRDIGNIVRELQFYATNK